ncbi:MAG: tRNA pseudouridine synthase [Pseudomonadota bacterium]|jgi:tRNA pseudouridine38-40 synthase
MNHQKQITVLVEFAYQGHLFHGLAIQPDVPTVGGALKYRLAEVFAEPPRALTFAARTDAGVSAEQNFATFRVTQREAIQVQLGALVQETQIDGLRVLSARTVSPKTNARTSACAKSYRYEIQDGVAQPDPRERPWQIYPVLDERRMLQAAQAILGEHDFSAFRAAGCSAKTTVRVLHSLSITREGDRVRLDFEGNGFLRKMVRILSGTLAEVGAQLREPDEISALLLSRSRPLAGFTAPARGLTLRKVSLVELPTDKRS